MNKKQVINLIKTILKEELTDDDSYLIVLRGSEILENDEGLLVRLADGQQLQITVDHANISVRRVHNMTAKKREELLALSGSLGIN